MMLDLTTLTTKWSWVSGDVSGVNSSERRCTRGNISEITKQQSLLKNGTTAIGCIA